MATVLSNDQLNGDNLNKSGVHSLMDSMLSQVEEHLAQNNNSNKVHIGPDSDQVSSIHVSCVKDDSAVDLDSSALSDELNVTDVNEHLITFTSSMHTHETHVNQSKDIEPVQEDDNQKDTTLTSDQDRSQSENHLKETLSIDSKHEAQLEAVSKDSTCDKLNESSLVTTTEFEWTNVVEEESGEAVVLKKIIKEGQKDSRKPEAGDRLRYRITTKNSANSQVILSETFDETTVILGDYDTIGGIYLALSKMQKEEVAEVLIDHTFGFGIEGRLPEVPANCRLLCTIELLDIEAANFGQNDTFEKRFEMIRQKKDKGNFWFGCNRTNLALFCYQRVLELMQIQEQELVNRDELLQMKRKSETNEETIQRIDEERDAINLISLELLSIRFACCNNMAATFLKLGMHNSALEAVNMALVIDETNVKALFRKGKIYAEMNEYENALKFLTRANQLDPKNRAVAQEIVRLRSLLKSQNEKDKKLYEKMIEAKKTDAVTETAATSKSMKETKKRKKKIVPKNQNSTFGQYSNHLKWGLAITGVALTGFFIYKKFEK